MRRESARSLILSKEEIGSTFLTSIKIFLIREFIMFCQNQSNFMPTHHDKILTPVHFFHQEQ